MLKKPAFHIDLATCTGCKTCMIACKDRHDLPAGVKWRRVSEFSGGGWVEAPDGTFTQDVFAYYLSVSCNHCDDPICVKVCPTTAMHKDAFGIVKVDHDKCVGCRYCEMSCPYRAPQFNAKIGMMTKCDFCEDLQQAGQPPACVAACPARSLTFGERDELEARFGPSAQTAPLPDPAVTRPNLLVSPGRTAKSAHAATGRIRNPEEV